MKKFMQWFLNMFGKKEPTIQVQVSVNVFFDGKLLNEENLHVECTAENPIAVVNVKIPSVEKGGLYVQGDITTDIEDRTCENKTIDECERSEILQRYTSLQPNAPLKVVDISPISKEETSPQSQTGKSWNNVDINYATDYSFQGKDIKCADNPKDTSVDNNTPSKNSSTETPIEFKEISPFIFDSLNQNNTTEIEILNIPLKDIVDRANSLLNNLAIEKINIYLFERIKTVCEDASSKINSFGSEYDKQILSEFSSENAPLLKFVKEMIAISKENWDYANLSKDKEQEQQNADLFDKFLKKLFANTPVKEISSENPIAIADVKIPSVEKGGLHARRDITSDTEDEIYEDKTLDECKRSEILQRYTSLQPNDPLKVVDISPTSKEKISPQSQTGKFWNNVDIDHAADYPFQGKDIMCADNPKDTSVDNNTPSKNSSTATPVEVKKISPSVFDSFNQNNTAEIEILNIPLKDIVNRANSLLNDLAIEKINIYLFERIKNVCEDASCKINSLGSEYDKQILSDFSSENAPLLKFVKEMIAIRKENWDYANLSKDKEREQQSADLFDKFLEKLFSNTPVMEISDEKNFDEVRHREVSSTDACQGAIIIETCQKGFEFDGIILDKAIVKTI